MTEVNLENCDKTIAEFMGYEIKPINVMGVICYEIWNKETYDKITHFTKSLDSLVPVWEKLNKHLFLEVCRHEVKGYHWCFFRDLHNKNIDNIDEQAFKITIQQAAALATAKAVQELTH